MLSSVRLWSVRHLSVTFMHPTQAIEIFSNVFTPSADIQLKFYGDNRRGSPPSGKLNSIGVAKTTPLPSDRQHLSYDVCLEVRGEIIRTVTRTA